MTTLEVKLDLPDWLAREAQASGLLTPQALFKLIEEALQQHAAQTLLTGASRASEVGSKSLPMREIQAEVNAVRNARRAKPVVNT